jgi:hypothetical protein
MEQAVRSRLEREIEAGKAEDIWIEHFVCEGVLEEEAIRFAEHNHITLLVVEGGDGDSCLPDASWSGFQKIRHRIACRVERVSPRRNPELQIAKWETT